MRFSLRATIALLLLVLLTSCRPASVLEVGESVELASSTENRVTVVVALQHDGEEHFTLSATFTPLDSGLHLYSKDVPREGVGGLGRPTLLELAENSKLIALGDLVESVPPEVTEFAPKELMVYPVGAVTLSIPVALPPGNSWLDEKVYVTYMACSDKGCRPPVEGKAIEIRVPNSETRLAP